MPKPARQKSDSLGGQRGAQTLSRRRVLKGAAAAALVTAGPWIIQDAFSSSGELDLLHWTEDLPEPIVRDFEAKTGIKVNSTKFARPEAELAALQATKGQGYDLCQPNREQAPEFQDLGLLQPFDLDKLPAHDGVLPFVMEASVSAWTWDGKLYHLPHCWGSEAIAWRTDLWTSDPKAVSFGDLWSEYAKGKLLCRPRSLITGIGLWKDATGELPSNRMLDAFKDEAAARKLFEPLAKFAIAHRSWIKREWADADDIEAGFTEGSCAIGQTWDWPIHSLRQEGKPVAFSAPKEGAIAWLLGWSMPSAAQNVEQAYEWLNYLLTPEVAARLAEESGHNPVVSGADALLSPGAAALFRETYPGDALARLWWRPPEPPWYGGMLDAFAKQLASA